jgi:hypothetical protein
LGGHPYFIQEKRYRAATPPGYTSVEAGLSYLQTGIPCPAGRKKYFD